MNFLQLILPFVIGTPLRWLKFCKAAMKFSWDPQITPTKWALQCHQTVHILNQSEYCTTRSTGLPLCQRMIKDNTMKQTLDLAKFFVKVLQAYDHLMQIWYHSRWKQIVIRDNLHYLSSTNDLCINSFSCFISWWSLLSNFLPCDFLDCLWIHELAVFSK